ncbi:MAG TPA: alpha/beta hydrolase [Rhodocyclaceae bacterium]
MPLRLKILVALLCSGLLSACVTHTGQPAGAQPSPAGKQRFERSNDLTYTPSAQTPPLQADLFLPAGAKAAPVIVLIHGGGWRRGERGEMDGIAEAAAQRGYAVFNMSYRFAPAHPYPAALDDVRSAIGWVRAHAAEKGLDPSRVAVWGYSAGAHLAALAATQTAPAALRPNALVAGGVPADLVRASDSDLVKLFMGGDLAAMEDRYREASPLLQVSADDPPGFFYHGTWDLIVWPGYSKQMQAALSDAGIPAELYLIHGLGHIATFLFDGGAVEAALDFLDRQMPPKP